MKTFPNIQSEVQFIQKINNCELHILREDKIHPTISGNKFRKLKYNLEEFSKGNYNSLLTFGGAYSNHIVATAAAGKEFGFNSIGIIRGEELVDKIDTNPTLKFAKECGMTFHFISRKQYQNKYSPEFLEKLNSLFGNFYLLPEGGTNKPAVRGCEEILGEHTSNFDFICCAIGTGGTISGIINASLPHQQILGFPALKDSNFLKNEIIQFSTRSNWNFITDFHFGGYAKFNDELLYFINDFKQQYNVPLEPIYTGKMIFGIYDLFHKGYFPKESKILAIHTGGLQGIDGINIKLKQKNKIVIA